MAEFTVEAASQKKSGIGRNNDMQVIALTLTDGTTTHQAEWFTSEKTAIPQPGTRGEWTLEPGQYGLKAKKASNGARGGFGGGRSPQDTAAIQRQHSQGVAVALLHVKAAAGKLTDEDLTPKKIKELTDFFDDDISAGVERKLPSQRMVNGLPVHNEPQRTGAPESVTPSANYDGIHPADLGDVPWGEA